VICCRGSADEAMRVMRSMMSKLRLTVNETKTRLCRVPEESVTFLSYTIGLCHSPRTGRSYIGTKPSAKAIVSLKAEIHELTERRWLWTTVEDRVVKLNRMLLGWSNYFCLGPVSPAYRAIDRYARHRLRQWLRGKHKLESRGTTRFPDASFMTNLASSACAIVLETFRGRRGECLSESRMREIRPSGSMSGEWKRSVSHRATPRLY